MTFVPDQLVRVLCGLECDFLDLEGSVTLVDPCLSLIPLLFRVKQKVLNRSGWQLISLIATLSNMYRGVILAGPPTVPGGIGPVDGAIVLGAWRRVPILSHNT